MGVWILHGIVWGVSAVADGAIVSSVATFDSIEES